MKKTLLVLVMLWFVNITFAQESSIVNGTADKSIYSKVYLYKILNGRLSEIATSTPDSLGRFGFRFTPEYKGLYALGSSDVVSQRGVFKFYFKGNDELNLQLEKNTYKLNSKNTRENEKLAAWFAQSYSLLDKAVYWTKQSTYVDFFPEVEDMAAKLATIKKDVNTGNPSFDKLFPTIVDFDFAYYAIGYLYTPRSAHPSKEEWSDYYMNFNSDHYLTEDLLKFPYGDRFLNTLVYQKVNLTTKPTFDQQVSAIPSDVIKGQYILQHLERSKSYLNYQEIYDEYKQYFILTDQKARAQAVAVKLADTKEGTPAFNFSFPDKDGKAVSLADLKGKIVLVDIWATWCGPCKAEEPHWEKLNEEFSGKDVVFVGVSVDQDKKAWEAYVPEKALKGIQLHAGSKNDLSQAYQVNGIPRYILIDKKGNLITSESPRPSDPKLKELISTWLAK